MVVGLCLIGVMARLGTRHRRADECKQNKAMYCSSVVATTFVKVYEKVAITIGMCRELAKRTCAARAPIVAALAFGSPDVPIVAREVVGESRNRFYFHCAMIPQTHLTCKHRERLWLSPHCLDEKRGKQVEMFK